MTPDPDKVVDLHPFLDAPSYVFVLIFAALGVVYIATFIHLSVMKWRMDNEQKPWED